MSSSAALKKVRKSHRAEATEVETKVAQTIYDMEQESKTLKTALVGFTINSVREIEVSATKNAFVVFYPLRFVRKLRKVQKNVTATLEKKLGQNVVFVAQRKIERATASSSAPIPRNRTMKAVHEAVLDDLCFPAEICGKRIRQLTDGSKHLKVFLEQKDLNRVQNKLDTFTAAYNKLTGRNVAFGFMSNSALQQIVA